ncbi:MAG: PAS domain-containing protein [Capsulimonadales bacterium]|nr:PAS domain-containing protein [Capsulimonadales bacterium]
MRNMEPKDGDLAGTEGDHHRFFRLIVEQAHEGVWLIDPGAATVYVNPRMAKMLGFTPEEMVGRSAFDFVFPEDIPRYQISFAERKSGVAAQIEVRWRRQDGSELFTLVSSNPILDEKGRFVAGLALVSDLSERRRAENRLVESENRLRIAQEAGRLGLHDFNVVTGDLIWDTQCKALFGLPPEAENITIDTFWSGVHPEDRERIASLVERGLDPANGEFQAEYRTVGLADGGKVRWLYATGRTFFDESGRPLRLVGTVQDITGQKLNEIALQIQLERQRLLSEIAADLLTPQESSAMIKGIHARIAVHLEADVFFQFGLIDDSTLQLEASAGVSPEVETTLARLSLGDGICGVTAKTRRPHNIRDIQQGGGGAMAEMVREIGIRAYCCHPLIVRDRLIGTLSFGSRRRSAFDVADVEFMEIISRYVASVKERDRVEAAMRASEERLRLAVEGGELGTWHWSIAADELIWSEGGKRIFDFPPDVSVTHELTVDRIHPEDRDRVAQSVRMAIERQAEYREEYRIRLRDGNERWIMARGHAYYDADGTPVRFEGFILDITERKRREEEIRRLNQELVRMMRETHHRVKNNLQTVAALIEIHAISGNGTTGPDSERVFDRLKTHVMTLATVHDLLTDQAGESQGSGDVSILPLLHRLIEMLARVQMISIRHRIEDIRLPARAATALATITSELLSNAFKHGNGTADVTLTVDDSVVYLRVADDGPGFPPDFDVAQRANTGLDLVVMMTDHNLGGSISFSNREPNGAQVTIRFPRWTGNGLRV